MVSRSGKPVRNQRTRFVAMLVTVFLAFAILGGWSGAGAASEITQQLQIVRPGLSTERLSITEAMKRLNIPSAGVTLIHNGEMEWSSTFGENEGGQPVFQAASLSKF